MIFPPHQHLLRLSFSALTTLWMMTAAAHAQTPWRSSLYPVNWQPPGPSTSFASAKMIQDFSYAGYRRGEELIPNITGPVFDVIQYGADPSGASDSTTAIQNAINAASNAGGGVVLLPAGEFRIRPQGSNTHALRINASNIVLRGAGHAQTFLLNTSTSMRGKSVIRAGAGSTTLGTAQPVTANLPGPTHRIPVENAGSFSPGDIVHLQWNFTSAWIEENNQQTWWGTSSPSSARYYREVVAVNAQEGWVELDVPTRYWIKTRDNPTLRTVRGLRHNVGIESLSIGNLQHPGTGWGENDYDDSTKAAYDTHASWLIRYEDVRDAWITNVRSRQAASNTSTCHMLSNGILLQDSIRITVQNCHMRRPQYGGGGGNGYMFRLQHSNECLIRSCIADFSRHGLVVNHAGTSGNVFLQCEDRETKRATGSSSSGYTTSGSGSDNHQFFSHSNLWDQCHAHNSFYTAHHREFNGGSPPHGLTSAHGVYWNTTGSGTRYAGSSSFIVRSEQLNQGYIIGTRATDGGDAYHATIPTAGNTSPADHREGVNTGGGLQPQSLYLDQIARRLRPIVTFASNGGSSPSPASRQVAFSQPYGPLPATTRAGFSFTGWFTAPTGGSRVNAETTVANSSDHTLFAVWNALPSVNAGDDQTLASTAPRPWSPQFAITAAWFDAADPATLTVEDGTVSLWQDKSEHQNHASQATPSRRPATGSATIGGWNAVRFDPFRDQHLAAPHHPALNLDASGGANLFAVFHSAGYVNRASHNSIVSKGSLPLTGAAFGIRVETNSRLSFKAGDSLFSSPTVTTVSQDLLFSGIRDDQAKSALTYIDGTLRATANAGASAISSDNTSPLVLGGETFTARCADVRIGEFILLPGPLPAESRGRIEGYLAHKWSLAAKLPANHPHKETPPTYVASTTLTGSANDPENEPITNSWSLVSGPGEVLFTQPSAPTTTVTFSRPGTYVLRLQSGDGTGTSADDVAITVLDPPPPDPFDEWTGITSSPFGQDSNQDGLADGLAWLLGAENPATQASLLLPQPVQENDSLAVTFHYLPPALRGSYSLRLQASTSLAPDSWSEINIPDASATTDGVVFAIRPLPDGKRHEIKASFPPPPSGRIFVRLSSSAAPAP